MSTELIKRGAFTLGALLVCLAGIYIPLPGVDADAWRTLFDAQSRGMLGQANALSGGALSRLSILSLSITPYLTSAIIVQLLAMVSPAIGRLRNDGERGRATLERYTIAATVFLAALQGYGIAIGLEGVGSIVAAPGLFFRSVTMLTLTAGMLFLVWLAGQITERGLGNGVALIIAVGIVNTLPRETSILLEASRLGIMAPGTLLKVLLVVVAMTVLVVMVERARRRLPVAFAERRIGTQTLPRQTADIALKLNPAGLMPPVIVGMLSSIVLIVLSIATLLTDISGWVDALNITLGAPVRLGGTAVLMVLITFVYTAFVCDPEQMAARLAACGGMLPGIAPGEPTAAHLDRTISRTAAVGAAYLVVVMVVPEALSELLGLPILLGGTPILVLVCVGLDLAAQVRTYATEPR
jgi:preprotein translocase subunit SecY